MASRIKGITVEIGGDVTGLDKALSSVNKQIDTTQKELKDVERLLKLDPKNAELLRQKYELLNKTVSSTEEKLDSLKAAEKQVQEQFKKGEVSEDQYNALKREIEATEISLRGTRQEAQKTADKIKGVDERPIEEVADAAGDAERQLKEAGDEASNFGDFLKAGAIIEGAKGIAGAIKDVAESTKDYQKIMGSLEVSSEAAGYSAEETEEIYKKLYGVLADDQSAATTTANLQAIGVSQDKLTKLTTATIGAWAKYGDSIPIDGLAEAINHTSQLGEVQGTLADVLEWAGVSVEDFNARLAECSDAEERANLILQHMTDQGLVKSGQAWRENNKALVENNEAQAEMQNQMADLGETVMPILTEVTKLVAKLLEKFNGLDEGVQVAILGLVMLVATVGPLISVFGGASAAISAVSKAMNFLMANPMVLLVAAIVGLVLLIGTKGDEIQAILQKVDDFLQGVFLTDWTQIFGPGLGDILNGFFAGFKDLWDSAKMIMDGIIDFVRGVFTGDWERVWSGVQQIFSGVFGGLEAIAKAPLKGIIGIMNMVISGLNMLIGGLNKISINVPSWVPLIGGKSFGFNIGSIPSIPYFAKGGIFSNGSAIVGEAGPEILTLTGGAAYVKPITNNSVTHERPTVVNVNVYGAPGQDVNELAERVAEKIQDSVTREEASFA